ncbi:hypothetical protein E2562_021491 [Oryza meyeriana var. granulata]|uniref:Uncharacterized protein n=1 Tax=Oryza meyeriana var. granulata TaxID=110450 RepID=A0A6G1E010_9ORYZ|nr:hypothetical protein E2562_021491 [Oryza meyeriana var. granulata]
MASIICNSLPRLKKLEIPNSDMSCAAIIRFLDCLEELEYLDISGNDPPWLAVSCFGNSLRSTSNQ